MFLYLMLYLPKLRLCASVDRYLAGAIGPSSIAFVVFHPARISATYFFCPMKHVTENELDVSATVMANNNPYTILAHQINRFGPMMTQCVLLFRRQS